MTRTVKDLDFTEGGSAALVSYAELPWVNGSERALWVEDEYLKGRYPYVMGRYTIRDAYGTAPLDPHEDIDDVIALWKRSVGWDDVPEGWNVQEGRWQHNIDTEENEA